MANLIGDRVSRLARLAIYVHRRQFKPTIVAGGVGVGVGDCISGSGQRQIENCIDDAILCLNSA